MCNINLKRDLFYFLCISVSYHDIPTTPESSILKAPVFDPPLSDAGVSPKGRPTAAKCTGRKPRFPLFSSLNLGCFSKVAEATNKRKQVDSNLEDSQVNWILILLLPGSIMKTYVV